MFNAVGDKAKHINILRWDEYNLISLIRLLNGVEEVKNEKEIVEIFSSPSLLRMHSIYKVNDVEKTHYVTIKNINEKFKRIFEHNLSPELEAAKTISFIAHLVFNRAHDHLLADFAAKMKLEVNVLQTILQRLKSASILRSKHGRYFIVPEVKGDFYMAGELDAASDLSELLDGFMQTDPKNAGQKIVEIAQFTTPKTRERLADYLNNYLISCERQLLEKPELLHRAHIGLAEEVLNMEIRYGIQSATDAAFSLVTSALLHQAQSNEKGALDNVLTIPFTNAPQGDEYGRFLETAVHLPQKRAYYLSLLQVYWKSGYKANAHNYKPTTLLSAAFRPFANSKESYQTGLQYARHWLLDSGDPQLRSMAVHALQVMLGHFLSTSVVNTIQLPSAEMF